MFSSPSCTTATIWLCSFRTSRVALFTAFLKRETNIRSAGVMATAISVKSQLSQNIRPSMQKIVSRSTRMSRVEPEANP